MTARSVRQEELPLLQTTSGCHLYSTCLKKGDGHGSSPSPPWEAGLCPRNIARGAPAALGVTPFHSSVCSLPPWLCSQATVSAWSSFTRQQGHVKVNTQELLPPSPEGNVRNFMITTPNMQSLGNNKMLKTPRWPRLRKTFIKKKTFKKRLHQVKLYQIQQE